MARVEPGSFTGKSVVLVFIAGSVREAERAEAALTDAGVDYCLEAEEFLQGMLSSPRAGLGFYVPEPDVSLARHRLAGAGLQSGIVEEEP